MTATITFTASFRRGRLFLEKGDIQVYIADAANPQSEPASRGLLWVEHEGVSTLCPANEFQRRFPQAERRNTHREL